MLLYAIALIGALVLYGFRILPWIGRVTRVVDGDSVEARHVLRIIRIRLIGLDAPEYRQPHGKEARRALADLVEDRLVLFIPFGIDRYGRLKCHIVARFRLTSASLLVNGHAWHTGPIGFVLAIPARLRRIGLWADRNRVRPDIWRMAQRMGMRTR